MTNDKTVTMSREAAKVLVETFRDCLHRGKQPTFSAGDLRYYIDELNKLAAPVVERQDAPFYISMSDWNTLVRDDVEIASVRISRTKRSVFTEPLHASPPAPVAVTMKDMMIAYEAASAVHLHGTSNWCAVAAKHLNNRIDKVKELNQ